MKIDKRLLQPDEKKNQQFTEAETWALYGCANNQEWHDLLNLWCWKEFTPDEIDGCYIGIDITEKNKKYKKEDNG